jgi:ribonuclease BN (tRNA processing enzyme)
VRLTILGGCGAWPAAGQACSGYLVEHDGFRLLLDPGYATLPRLLAHLDAADVDAVFVSHGHPDHCADLNPLLRARVLGADPAPVPLPLYAPPGALDAVLALDRPGMLDAAYTRHDLAPDGRLRIGPFDVRTAPLPHSRPNLGIRLDADGQALAYTGDTGPDPAVVTLARGAAVLIAEASFPEEVPEDSRAHLSSAAQAGGYADDAGAGYLVLTHLLPGTDEAAARAAAGRRYRGGIALAAGGLRLDLADIR